MMSQWKTQLEGPGSASSYSRATESSTEGPMSLLSSHSSGGAVASSSFSGVWSSTLHRLGGTAQVRASPFVHIHCELWCDLIRVSTHRTQQQPSVSMTLVIMTMIKMQTNHCLPLIVRSL